MSTFLSKKERGKRLKGFIKNPFFSFSSISLVLFGLLLIGAHYIANTSYGEIVHNAILRTSVLENKNLIDNSLFIGQNQIKPLETPDLKIVQDSFVYGISTPLVLTTQTLGSLFGGSGQDKKEITEYVVQAGDTPQSVADTFSISLNTVLWANNIVKSDRLKTGQTLVILPVSGLVHVVKSGDTVSEIAKKYKATIEDILTVNNLANEGDIFIGDILIIPGGTMPVKAAPLAPQTQVVNSFFIIPAEGVITQGLHWFNAIDLANKCGTPIYAAASGVVQRVRYGWNGGGGNYVTILHSNGVTTYYGHLMSTTVSPGTKITVGDRIGLMGQTGKATGCHVHFQVIGAANPLAKYSLNAWLKYKP